MNFPLEQPTAKDFNLWHDMVVNLTSPTLRWSPRLGTYRCPPPQPITWWTNAANDYVLQKESGKEDIQYVAVPRKHNTRHSKQFVKTLTSIQGLTPTHIASVTELTTGNIELHSAAPLQQNLDLIGTLGLSE